MKQRRIFRLGAIVLGILVFLFGTLVVHVGLAVNGKKNDRRLRELGRIDFTEDINARQGSAIRAAVAAMEGISGVAVNEQADNVTFMFDPAQQSTAQVFVSLTRAGYKAIPYRVSKNDQALGCPAFAEKGPFSKAVLYCASALFD